MRLLLPLRIDARSLMLDEGGRRPQAAVGPDGKDDHAAAAVVGDQDVLSLLVHDQVART